MCARALGSSLDCVSGLQPLCLVNHHSRKKPYTSLPFSPILLGLCRVFVVCQLMLVPATHTPVWRGGFLAVLSFVATFLANSSRWFFNLHVRASQSALCRYGFRSHAINLLGKSPHVEKTLYKSTFFFVLVRLV